MKLVVAIIQPTKVDTVQVALANVGVERMTVCDAAGFARQRGLLPTYRGMEYNTQLLRKIMLEIVVNDDFVDRTIETIMTTAKTGPEGTIGDGKIFVFPVDEVYQISEDLVGPEAV